MPKLHTINNNSYQVITNFEDCNEKECIKMDKKNEKIYSALLSQAESAEKKLKNSVLSFNLEIPPPPRPCNRDRYNLWKKRNVSKPVIAQSDAVLFLKSKGYELDQDYEAYQAIDLSKEIKRAHGIVDEVIDDKTTQFNTLFTERDTNLMRRKSSLKMKTYDKNMILNEPSVQPPPNPSAPPDPLFNHIGSFSQSTNIKPTGPPFSHNIVFPEKGVDYNF